MNEQPVSPTIVEHVDECGIYHPETPKTEAELKVEITREVNYKLSTIKMNLSDLVKLEYLTDDEQKNILNILSKES